MFKQRLQRGISRTGHGSRLSLALLFGASLVGMAAPAAVLPRFPAGAVWNQDISAATLHPNSATMISTLAAIGGNPCGFGFCRMQIDFSNHVVWAAIGAPTLPIAPHATYGYYSPDCDASGNVPVPAGGAIEGTTGYDCDNEGEDCHYLVVQGNTLFELYSTDRNDAQTALNTLCLATWRLDVVYPPEGRGEHCTSADAAGFPMIPLLFNADEIAAAIPGNGDLGHAIRFVLPNPNMANDVTLGGEDGYLYVRPASHAGAPAGPVGSVPYGSRLRLRADFPLTNYSPGAQVILRTLKKYGMVLADGGNIALTAESDRYTTNSWASVGINSRTFDQTSGATKVQITDFQVLDTGPRIAETYNCVPTVLPLETLFANGFE
ncbi:hypothetical protein [Ahniella affigens]|nr:hypothetical protein [Ahniella affigens]